MLLKKEMYSVTGKVTADSGKKNIIAYQFEDSKGNKYILRFEEAQILIGNYNHLVNNAMLNHKQKGLNSKDGSDLRKIPEIVVSPEKYLTQIEFKDYMEQVRELSILYKQGKIGM